jgi:hypothetical protein
VVAEVGKLALPLDPITLDEVIITGFARLCKSSLLA